MAEESLNQIDHDLVETSTVTHKKVMNKLSKEQTL